MECTHTKSLTLFHSLIIFHTVQHSFTQSYTLSHSISNTFLNTMLYITVQKHDIIMIAYDIIHQWKRPLGNKREVKKQEMGNI